MANQQGRKQPDSDPIKKENEITLFSQSDCGIFEIYIKGHLNNQWSDWLEGFQAKRLDNGEKILYGTTVDQAALIGILNKLNRLNLTLIFVNEANKSLVEKS